MRVISDGLQVTRVINDGDYWLRGLLEARGCMICGILSFSINIEDSYKLNRKLNHTLA